MDFETAAMRAKEDRIRLFRRECMLSSVAVANNAAAWLAELWGSDVSTQQINRRAQIWDTFPLENVIPDISLALYGAALDAAASDGVLNPTIAKLWLVTATEERWSSRDLRDAADILKGKHLSSTAFRGRVAVITWDVPTGTLTVEGLPLSGDAPVEMDVIAREVLDKGEQ